MKINQFLYWKILWNKKFFYLKNTLYSPSVDLITGAVGNVKVMFESVIRVADSSLLK